MKRLKPADRKDEILLAAVAVAKFGSYTAMTRAAVAELADCAPSLVQHYFRTMGRLRRDVMRYAVKHEILGIVAEGLALKNRHAMKASDDLKQKATRSILL